MAKKKIETGLYTDQRGRITCKEHVPLEGSDTWTMDRWKSMKASEGRGSRRRLAGRRRVRRARRRWPRTRRPRRRTPRRRTRHPDRRLDIALLRLALAGNRIADQCSERRRNCFVAQT